MGPLNGLKVIEFAGVGAGPFAGMMFSDMGAEVVQVDKTTDPALGVEIDTQYNLLRRGKRSIAVDLKCDSGREVALSLIDKADVLIESFRPGVMERLGLGPADCMARNPRLVYGRMTGWGQDGPYASMAGHDINYIALSGVLDAIGPQDGPPLPPLNLVGDFGGAMMFGFGLMCATWETARSGIGQVVDGAMVDAASYLMTMIHGFQRAGIWSTCRGDNVVDGGAPFYGVYRTADNKHISLGPIESKFYEILLEKLELSDDFEMRPQMDRSLWPAQKRKIAKIIESKSREEWCERFEGTDVCFAPVLSIVEAPDHSHLRIRSNFVEVDGLSQPAPVPRFSRSNTAISSPPSERGAHSKEVLLDCGFSEEAAQKLMASQIVVQA